MDFFCRLCGHYPWRDPAPIADPPRCLTVVEGEAFIMVGDDRPPLTDAPLPYEPVSKIVSAADQAAPGPGEVCPTCGKRRAMTPAQRAKKARAAKAASNG